MPVTPNTSIDTVKKMYGIDCLEYCLIQKPSLQGDGF